MKTVILCGGQGTRIQEATGGIKPKPMVEVGGRPILWHIMKTYAHWGHTEFVLCLGHLGNVIKDYFLHYRAMNSDITLKLDGREVQYHGSHGNDWSVTLTETGAETMTGARLARVQRYVSGGTFMLTYGDGVCDVDLGKLVVFHRKHGKLVTVTGVMPAGRFGRLATDAERVIAFDEKPAGDGSRINGGFFVCEPGVFDYVSMEAGCVLEREPLERLARDGQLMMYRHEGFWQCMDTYRDLVQLEGLWQGGAPPWRVWEP